MPVQEKSDRSEKAWSGANNNAKHLDSKFPRVPTPEIKIHRLPKDYHCSERTSVQHIISIPSPSNLWSFVNIF
jgi:hypothetical protein